MSVNSQGLGSATPLSFAAVSGQLGMMDFLLSQGADINEVSRGSTVLAMAVENGRFDLVKALIERGAKTDFIDESGASLLMIAVQNRKAETVKVLLQLGADPNLPNAEGKTPLMMAVIQDDQDIVDILLKAGANRDAKDPDGKKASDFGKSFGVKNLFSETPVPAFFVGLLLISFFFGASV